MLARSLSGLSYAGAALRRSRRNVIYRFATFPYFKSINKTLHSDPIILLS